MNIIRKVNFNLIKYIEKVIADWVWLRRYRIPIFILAVILLVVFSKAPYINLFFNTYLIIFMSVILAPIILDIDDKPLFALAIVLFILTLILWFSDRDGAEAMTNYIYVVLFSGVIKTIFSR